MLGRRIWEADGFLCSHPSLPSVYPSNTKVAEQLEGRLTGIRRAYVAGGEDTATRLRSLCL
jgi:hypothetical protein